MAIKPLTIGNPGLVKYQLTDFGDAHAPVTPDPNCHDLSLTVIERLQAT